MKLYMIIWGFYSSNEGGYEWDSIWTSKEAALKALNKTVDRKKLDKDPKRDVYTNGDYWVGISEIMADTDSPYDCEEKEIK